MSGRAEPLRLMETFRSLFYTPMYVAVAGGFLEGEGLDIQFSTYPPGHSRLSPLTEGIADIIQTGPTPSMVAADAGAKDVAVHFVEINSRDGFFLVGRAPEGQFRWTDLNGATLIPVGTLLLPKASLRYALKRQSVDMSEVSLVDGLSIPEAMDAFRRGEGDFIQVPQPATEQLVQEGSGHLVAALGPVTGHVSYSSFATTRPFLREKGDTVQRFTDGIYKAQRWLATHNAETVADVVSPFFPDVERAVVVGAVDRYKAQDTWATDPLLREDGYDTLQAILLGGGLVRSPQPYERIVETSFARRAIEKAETG